MQVTMKFSGPDRSAAEWLLPQWGVSQLRRELIWGLDQPWSRQLGQSRRVSPLLPQFCRWTRQHMEVPLPLLQEWRRWVLNRSRKYVKCKFRCIPHPLCHLPGADGASGLPVRDGGRTVQRWRPCVCLEALSLIPRWGAKVGRNSSDVYIVFFAACLMQQTEDTQLEKCGGGRTLGPDNFVASHHKCESYIVWKTKWPAKI